MNKILLFPLASLQSSVKGDVKIIAVILDKISMLSPHIHVYTHSCIHA